MKIYSPLSEKGVLRNPAIVPELELHFNLWRRLSEDGFKVRGGIGYMNPGPASRAGSYGIASVFDLIVFKNKSAQAIIEVKSADEGPRVNFVATHQALRYRQFGVPVILFWDMEDYDKLAESLRKSVFSFEDDNAVLIRRRPDSQHVVDLRRRLDTAQMAAFDAHQSTRNSRFQEIEHLLESLRDEVAQIK